MKILLTLCLLALLIPNSYSQVNSPIEKVKITYVNGATTEGEIYVIRPKDIFSPVKYKTSSGDWILLNGKSVESIVLLQSQQRFVSYNYITKNIESPSNSTSTFYKVLIEGDASLYYSLDSLKREFYYIKKETTLLRVTKKKKSSTYIDGKNYVKEDKANQIKINGLLSDCLPDKSLFVFSEMNLIKKVIAYNTCKKSTFEKAGLDKAKIVLGGVVGYSFSTIKFKDEHSLESPYGYSSSLLVKGTNDLSSLENEILKQSSFSIGLAFSIFPKWNKHFSFEFQPQLISRQWTSESQKFKMECSYLELPTVLKMNFNIKKYFQPTLGLGLNPSISLQSKYNSAPLTLGFTQESLQQYSSNGFIKITKVDRPIILPGEYSPSQQRIVTSAGFDLFTNRSKIGFNYRYEFLGSLTNSRIYTTSVSSQSILISFSLNPKRRF